MRMVFPPNILTLTSEYPGDTQFLQTFESRMGCGNDVPDQVYNAIIEAIDIEKLGLSVNPSQMGNPVYDPKAMLKLLVHGYPYGWHDMLLTGIQYISNLLRHKRTSSLVKGGTDYFSF